MNVSYCTALYEWFVRFGIRNLLYSNIFHSNLKLPDPESLSGESVAQNSSLGLTLSRRTSTVTHSSGHAFHVQCNLDLPIIQNKYSSTPTVQTELYRRARYKPETR